MVVGDALQLAIAQQVGAAVADVGDEGESFDDEGGGDGRAKALRFGCSLAVLDDVLAVLASMAGAGGSA